MAKLCLLSGGIFGFLAVALGAFGAHGLKSRLSEYAIGIFQTGVQYQFFHAIALIAVGLLSMQGLSLKVTAYSFIFGVLVFSGSLYILALSGQKYWGAITPIGGLSFLVGWAWLIYQVSSQKFN